MPDGETAAARAAQADANVALTREFWELAIERRDVAAAKQLLAPGFVHHETAIAPGADGFAAYLSALTANSPGLSLEPVRHVADGDFVVAHHRRSDGGSDTATIDIMRIEGGKIAEYWHVFQTVPEVMANPNGMF